MYELIYVLGATIFAGFAGYYDQQFDYRDGRDVFGAGLLSIFWPVVLLGVVFAAVWYAGWRIHQNVNQ